MRSRNDNWNLAVRICEESKDEVIDSVRIALLNDFGKTDEYGQGDNFRQLAACLKQFLPRRKAVIPEVAPGKPMILFPAASGSNLLNLLPVAQEARRRGLLGGIVAGESFQAVKSNALQEFGAVTSEGDLRSLIGKGFLPGSLARASRRLKRLIHRLNGIDRHCGKRVKQNYGAYLRLMVVSEGIGIAYRQLLSVWRPSFMLSTSDFWPAEFQGCWQAKQMGIPTAILQHGVINDMCVWPTYYDTFLAWGETFRDRLVTHGAPLDRVRVVGMPASDEIFQRPPVQKRPDVDPVCLVLSHTQDRVEEAELFEKFGRSLTEAIRSTPGVKWKIRLHPAEDDSFYRERGITALPGVEISGRDISLEQAVEEASVVCTIRSTAGLQAMMLQKPLIVLNFSSQTEPPILWPREGGGVYAHDADGWKQNIQKISNDRAFVSALLGSQEKFLNKTFANRGGAASAIVDFLEERTARPLSAIHERTAGLLVKT